MNLSKLKKVLKSSIFSLFIFGIAFSGFSESFRIRKTVMLPMSGITTDGDKLEEVPSENISVGINDAICILLPEDMTFIQGIELNIKIPSALAKCPNTVIYSLYENISPVPTAKTIDYTGKELYTAVYPGLISLTIQIPLVKGNTMKKTPYADKTLIPEHSRNFIFLRNQLVMKGVPQDAMNSQFTVSAKPVLINKGRLTVKTSRTKAENLTILVDGTQVELDSSASCLLKPGLHNVVISADSSRNENRSCMIEAGKTSVLEIDLQSTAPLVQISMPNGTHLTVDNQLVELKNNSLPLSPGDHILKFSLGGYEVVKHISVQEGRNYSINITLDADISEN